MYHTYSYGNSKQLKDTATYKWPFVCRCAVKKLLTHSLTHSLQHKQPINKQ